MKLKRYIYSFAVAATALAVTTSCDDMLDKGNDNVVYAQDLIPNTPADTVTSVLGILHKLQAISVRNNLLGEVRADLVDVNSNATTDLKNLALLDADVTGDDDANIYNNPRDYYAVINNCNYFLTYADSTAGNANSNEKYFKNEIAQVHSIRAWTYLQLVLAYGKVPLVVDPILAKNKADSTYVRANYPVKDIEGICEYFINDLKPYYGVEYPDYVNIGGDIDPQMCFFPTQVVMGDLYLWKAAATHDKEAAKSAAKSYYDYIVWDLSGKDNLYTSVDRYYWSENSLYEDRYMRPSFVESHNSVWGNKSCVDITKIPMDSAAADGYYNELRNLYNSTNSTTFTQASISPSQTLKDLSQSQKYVGYDTNKNIVVVDNDGQKFTEEQLLKGYLGDLRYCCNYSTSDFKYNSKEYDFQTISKHSSQHVSIYRATQLYLRLAEALNYAGYPRFARSILTMGLNNNVIKNEVQRYYTTSQDTAFINYFDFNNAEFIPYAETYKVDSTAYGVVYNVEPVLLSSSNTCNMWGVHSRGSGLAFLDTDYCMLQAPDSTDYPFAKQNSLGNKPTKEDYAYPTQPKAPTERTKPEGWDEFGGVKLSEAEWKEFTSKKSGYNTYSQTYDKYVTYTTVELPEYNAAMEEYNAQVAEIDAVYKNDLANYTSALSSFKYDYLNWYKSAYSNSSFIEKEQAVVDQAILDEQALELCYEGNRFYDLMRRALWNNDNSILANAVSKRDASVGAKLNDKKNWFLHWKNQIGY